MIYSKDKALLNYAIKMGYTTISELAIFLRASRVIK